MNKRTTRLIGVSLALCIFACALSFGVLATMNGAFALWGDNDTSVYADPDQQDWRTNDEAVYAEPEQGFRFNSPAMDIDPAVLPWRIITPH